MDDEKRCNIKIRKRLFDRLSRARAGRTWDDYLDDLTSTVGNESPRHLTYAHFALHEMEPGETRSLKVSLHDVQSKRFRKHIYYLRQKYGMRLFHEVGRLDQTTDEYSVLVYCSSIDPASAK
jgi:hypothetical protein